VDLNVADSGSIDFSNQTAVTFGALQGTRNLALRNTNGTGAAVSLTVGNNNSNTTYSGALTAPQFD